MAARKFSATWRSGAVKVLLVAEIRHDLNPWRKFAMAEKIAVAEIRHGEKISPWRNIAMAGKNRRGGKFFCIRLSSFTTLFILFKKRNDKDDALEVDKLLTRSILVKI